MRARQPLAFSLAPPAPRSSRRGSAESPDRAAAALRASGRFVPRIDRTRAPRRVRPPRILRCPDRPWLPPPGTGRAPRFRLARPARARRPSGARSRGGDRRLAPCALAPRPGAPRRGPRRVPPCALARRRGGRARAPVDRPARRDRRPPPRGHPPAGRAHG